MRDGFTWRKADPTRPNQRLIPRGAIDLAHNFGGARQMIDQGWVMNSRFDGLERSFLQDRGVQGTPTNVGTVDD
jgi:hypothetical protein